MNHIFHAIIAAWLKASQRSRVGVGMNSFARGRNVKHFEWPSGQETGL